MEGFEKGSEQWQFITDFWIFRKKWGNAAAEDPETWFDNMVAAGHELINKYKGTSVEQFAGDVVVAHWNDVDRRYLQELQKGRVDHGE